MALHFSDAEFACRHQAILAAMAAKGLDGLLMFRQESMYYASGYDTFGYVFFQCMILRADGDICLLTRSADLRQAQHTSLVKDIRVWMDRDGANPANDLRDLLAEKGLLNKRLGVEYDAYGLTAANGKRLDAALEGQATLVDASRLITEIRVVKSEEELIYVRRAAELADDAYDAALSLTGPGADEGAILAAMQGAIFTGGGDYPGNEFIIGSGRDALLCRYFSGRKHLQNQDQLTLEWAGAYRHYHAAMMRTLVIGAVPPAQQRMYDVSLEALTATIDALQPGNTYGEAFDAHAWVFDANGLHDHRLNACGYSLGTTFSPNWMDWPMLYHANPVEIAPGMIIFVHMILMDSDQGLAMTLGHTVEITAAGPKALSRSDLDLKVF